MWSMYILTSIRFLSLLFLRFTSMVACSSFWYQYCSNSWNQSCSSSWYQWCSWNRTSRWTFSEPIRASANHSLLSSENGPVFRADWQYASVSQVWSHFWLCCTNCTRKFRTHPHIYPSLANRWGPGALSRTLRWPNGCGMSVSYWKLSCNGRGNQFFAKRWCCSPYFPRENLSTLLNVSWCTRAKRAYFLCLVLSLPVLTHARLMHVLYVSGFSVRNGAVIRERCSSYALISFPSLPLVHPVGAWRLNRAYLTN